MDETEKLKDQVANLEVQVKDLEKDLIHDSLTSLKTRKFFEEETSIYLSVVVRVNEGKRRDWFGFKNLSILFFDIDHFKSINDKYGHMAGDEILVKVAQTIMRNVRVGDTVARWGGEEIVASLLGANEKDAKEKAESIRKSVEDLSFDTFPDLKVTVSAGVASNFKDASIEGLIKNADTAMYKAKQTGRNKVVAYSEIAEK